MDGFAAGAILTLGYAVMGSLRPDGTSSLPETGRHAEALDALAEADSIGGYEPATEYQALRSSSQRRARRAQR
jgi:hypothetical protein